MNTPHIPDDDFARDRNAVSAAYASTLRLAWWPAVRDRRTPSRAQRAAQ